jgi:hypothetical protein
MARGVGTDRDVAAMEMTKWFDTNYHYIVSEFQASQTFRRAWSAPVDAYVEARKLGIHTRPVLLGPVSFMRLGKAPAGDVDPLDLLDRLLPVYEDVLEQLTQRERTGFRSMSRASCRISTRVSPQRTRTHTVVWEQRPRHSFSLRIRMTSIRPLEVWVIRCLGAPRCRRQ